MPFIKIESKNTTKAKFSSEELPIIPSPDDVPIFFISEIGDGLDLVPLLSEINQKMGSKNPIYLYCHPSLKLNEEISINSFEEHAELFAKELESQLKAYFHPCIIVSTSIASSIALSATQSLALRKRETFLFVVEGATPEVFKNYFLNESYSGTVDLLNLFEKTANRATINIPKLTLDQIETISDIPLEKRLKRIEEIFISHQKSDLAHSKINYFRKLNQITLNYFEILNKYQPHSETETETKMSICSLLSKEFIDRLGQNFCGWDKYNQAETKFYIFDKTMDFLDQHKEIIASIIVNYINENVNEEYLLAKMWKDVAVDIDDYEKKHKKPTLLKKIKNAINISAAKISRNAKRVDLANCSDNAMIIGESNVKIQSEPIPSSENEMFFLRRNNTFPMFGRSLCQQPPKDNQEKESRTHLLLA